ncbi:helix-turn-helix transcriptional regulator [Liquorilactobacillus uvarum]|uniref:helix-turn-helix transcriptional regulator n=1 Tax=Liquorilactobacillus uvarum TaxID=303240 RepID=UPI00288AC7C9|nr:helix-turn-helix transcriptional regulator [Liquorilactobacillus uvarum]
MNGVKENEKFDIRSARVRAGLTQDEAAEKLGVSKRSFIYYEQGDRILRVDKAWKFSEICNIPFDRIIFFNPNYTSSVILHGKERE